MVERPDCMETRQLVPELASGVAAGDVRARALRHLVSCPDCRGELDAAAKVVDELLLLAPERQPAVGFECSVLARLAPATSWRPSRRTALLWAASIVIVAGLTAGAMWWGTAADRQVAAAYRETITATGGQYFLAVPLIGTGGRRCGSVFGYQGKPPWLYATADKVYGAGEYTVRLTTRDGRWFDLGEMKITEGRGGWGRTLAVRVDQIDVVTFVRPGAPTMTARFGGSAQIRPVA